MSHQPPHHSSNGENSSGDEMLTARLVHAEARPGRIRRLSGLPDERFDAVSLTGKQTLDLHPYFGPIVHDQPILAIDRVRYRGEPIAVTAAPGELTIAVETEELSPRATGSLMPNTRLVHVIDLLERSPLGSELMLLKPRTNRLASVRIPGSASSVAAFNSRRFQLAGPLDDPDGLVAASAWWGDGRVTIESPSSAPNEVQREIAEITGLPRANVEVVPREQSSRAAIPGAIGVEAMTVALARSGGRAVQIEARRGDFQWSGPRAVIAWAPSGNVVMEVYAGAVAGYLPLWIDDFARLIAERTAEGCIAQVDLRYTEQSPIAAGKDEWIAALTEAFEAAPQ